MKKLFTTLYLLFFFFTFGFSTTSRINSLGVDMWMIEKDDQLIWINPARVTDYQKSFICEVGEAHGSAAQPNINNNLNINNTWGGVVYPFEVFVNGSTLGVFIARPYSGFINQIGDEIGDVDNPSDLNRVSLDVTGAAAISLDVLSPNNKFDLFYSLPSISFYLNYASNIEERTHNFDGQATSGTVKVVRASIDFNLYAGKIFKNIGPFAEIDASLGIGFPYVNNLVEENVNATSPPAENDEHTLKTNSAFSFDTNLRGIINYKDTTKILLFLSYYISNFPNTFTSKRDDNRNRTYNTNEILTQIRTQQYNNILLTAALNKDLTEKTKMILALSVFNINLAASAKQEENGQKNEEFEVYNRYIYIPINLAFESAFTKIFTGRIGLKYNLISTTHIETKDPDTFNASGQPARLTQATQTTTSSDNILTLTFGVGLSLNKNLLFDFVMRQQLLFTGTYIISGIPESVSSSISLVYKF